MSYILEGLQHSFWSYLNQRSPQQERPRGDKFVDAFNHTQLMKIIDKSLGTTGEHPLHVIHEKNQTIIHTLLQKVYRNLSFDLVIKINHEDYNTKIMFRPLNSDQSYLMITSGQRRLYATKLLIIFNKLKPQLFNQNKISIQIHSGYVQIENPVYYYLDHDVKKWNQNIHFLIKNFINDLKLLQAPLVSLLQLSNANQKYYYQSLVIKKDSMPLKKFNKFTKMMNVVLNMGTEETMDEESFNQKIKSELQSFQKINSNFVQIQQDLSSIALYSNQNLSVKSKNPFYQFSCSLNEIQIKEIKSKLEVPQITSMLASNQRTFIVNHIKLAKPFIEKSLSRIATGGFSTIYLGEVEHLPISSHQLGKEEVMSGAKTPLKKKTFIIKRQKPNNRMFRSRVLHERQVLMKVKSALAVFIPKYYFIFNPPEQNRYDLLQQHITFQGNTLNLEEYVKKFKFSSSPQTMIYFFFMIIQGLRCLKDYSIAHLDLKPSNVMIGKKMSVKLIDFGQAFYPEVKNHQPGISIPYSAPQNFRHQKSYTHKNDIFSFGVLMHYLLTSKYPFFIFDEKRRQKFYKNSSIEDKWFFTPEGMQSYGQYNIFPFIQNLMGKCLHTDPRCRPQLEWISLILRQYLEYVR